MCIVHVCSVCTYTHTYNVVTFITLLPLLFYLTNPSITDNKVAKIRTYYYTYTLTIIAYAIALIALACTVIKFSIQFALQNSTTHLLEKIQSYY